MRKTSDLYGYMTGDDRARFHDPAMPISPKRTRSLFMELTRPLRRPAQPTAAPRQ
jgi:hypothetical protein